MASAMDRWVLAVSEELGLAPDLGDTRLILDMTKDVAHNVDRPAAPGQAAHAGGQVHAGPGGQLGRQLRGELTRLSRAR